MKHKKLLLLLASSSMMFSYLVPNMFDTSNFVGGPDNAEYEEKLVADFNEPDVVYEAPIKKAATVATTSVKIHYHNDDGKNLPDDANPGREFWVWCDGVNGSQFLPDAGATGTDMTLSIDFNSTAYNDFLDKKSISFIVKYRDGWVGQSENLIVTYKDYPADASGCTEIWCIPGEGNAVEIYKTERETQMDRFQLATFKDWKNITILSTAIPKRYRLYALTSNFMRMGTYEQSIKLPNYLVADGSDIRATETIYNSKVAYEFTATLNYTARPNVQYLLEGDFESEEFGNFTKTKYVSFHELYETPRFKQFYTYDGNDLGATYNEDGSTTFKVWAPTAARVRVAIYNQGRAENKSGTPESVAELYSDVEGSDGYGGYNMAFRPGGVWELTIKNKDLKNCYYNYYVINSLGENIATDPYAKACGVNGDRGMIVDWKETNPEGWDALPLKWDGVDGYDIKTPNELSIYETHIRDLTMDESWNGQEMRGTYAAFSESGTTVSKNGKTATTGYDHLKEMGLKAIHLLPVFDHDNNEDYGTPVEGNEHPSRRVYNWGYNPKNYNCVEGSYAKDPYNGTSRVTEFKNMILKFAQNENHTRIIMDVVYNHVSSAPGSCFNKLMPKYYFRYAEDGTYFDGSGCGNEVKSDAPMMSKYIVDSLCWWATQYKIKGFRFDLMGLLNVGTIDACRKALYKIDPDIIIYGEGWTGDGTGYDYGAREVYSVHGTGNFHDDPENPKALSQDQINLLCCMTASVYRYLYPVENACYVAAFNDAGRGAIRGDNDIERGWGFIDQGSGDVGDKSKTVADMMVGYHAGMGGNPNQCINYASCHDNYALFDQVMNAIPGWEGNENNYENPALACAAVAAVECAIMFSNGIALMQGGEELFRTKEVRSAADRKLVKESDSHVIKGHLVTHNAYNLSDDVNAFRWDRKIAIGSVDTTGYVENIMKAIRLRNSLTKYSYDDFKEHNPYDSASEFNTWGYGDGKTSIAVRNKNYFCFVSGCNDEGIPFGAYYEGTNKVAFTSNKTPTYEGFEPVEGGIKLGWYTSVCLYS